MNGKCKWLLKVVIYSFLPTNATSEVPSEGWSQKWEVHLYELYMNKEVHL